MSPLHDYFLGSIWHREIIASPDQVITDFCRDRDVNCYRKGIKALLLAATTEDIYSKGSPSDLLYEMKMVESLINAAYLINQQDRYSELEIGDEDLFNPALFRYGHGRASDWHCFPRNLSLKEYKNPYLAMRRFFRVMDLPAWKSILNDIVDFALGEDSINDAEIDIDLVSVYIYLTKLIESAYLIEARKVAVPGGSVKVMVKTKA